MEEIDAIVDELDASVKELVLEARFDEALDLIDTVTTRDRRITMASSPIVWVIKASMLNTMGDQVAYGGDYDSQRVAELYHDEAFQIALDLINVDERNSGFQMVAEILGDGYSKRLDHLNAYMRFKQARTIAEATKEEKSIIDYYHNRATREEELRVEKGGYLKGLLEEDKPAAADDKIDFKGLLEEDKPAAADDKIVVESAAKDMVEPSTQDKDAIEHSIDVLVEETSDNPPSSQEASTSSSLPTDEGRKFSRCIYFSIGKALDYQGRVFLGSMKNSCFSFERTFIETTNSESRDISQLQSWGKSNENILRVDFEEVDDDNKKFLVCEKCVTVEHYFIEQRESFEQGRHLPLGDKDKKEWWRHISDDFNQIFRDATRGLIFLYSNDQKCGDLWNNIFVTPSGRGRILPSMDLSWEGTNDVSDLRRKMEDVIVLPFGKFEMQYLVDYDLPQELIHLLHYMHQDKLKFVKGWWLFNHPYFWKSKERLHFIYKLQDVMKENIISRDGLNLIMGARKTYGEAYQPTWSSRIDNAIYQAIFDKGKTKQVAAYVRALDINRFIVASLGHVNDDEYMMYPERAANVHDIRYSKSVIEAHLREYFPEIYIELFACLLNMQSLNTGRDVMHLKL